MSFAKTLRNTAAITMGMMGSASLLNPTQAQTNNDRDVWMFNIGTSYIPKSGTNFDFHAVVPGITKWDFIETGARLTGKSIGSSITVKEENRNGNVNRITYFGTSRQFSTAYLKYTLAPKVEFGKDGVAMAGVYAQANVFAGGQNNLLNFADVGVGLTGRVFAPIGGGFGVYASVNAAFKTFKNNNNIFDDFAKAQGIVTENERNPKLEGRFGIGYRF
jgi:hypothetical protein